MLLREPDTSEAFGIPDPSASCIPFLPAGNPRPVLRAARDSDAKGVLALVLESEGSTYVHAGAMAYFGTDRQVGWLSGGCLEHALAVEAAEVAAAGRLGWMEIDTRDDDDLLSGSAIGCRGRLRLALLPLGAMPGLEHVLDAWIQGAATLAICLDAEGGVHVTAGGEVLQVRLPMAAVPWQTARLSWSVDVQRLPTALLLGAGPETPALLRLLHDVGWRTALVECRPRWLHPDAPIDLQFDDIRAAVAAEVDVALVMHHHFELDREALDALACTSIPFIGLLGPKRRREDLFKVLTPQHRVSLAPRLHSPVGLPLGGQGPEAIALSIAAQLQVWRSAAQP